VSSMLNLILASVSGSVGVSSLCLFDVQAANMNTIIVIKLCFNPDFMRLKI